MRPPTELDKEQGFEGLPSANAIVIGGTTDKIIWAGPRTIPVDYGLVNDPAKQIVYCRLKHRNVVLKTTTETIKAKKHSVSRHPTALSGSVYNLPLKYWEFHQGDTEWRSKLYADFKWAED